MVEIKSSFLVFLITSDVLQDDEFMQRKEKAIKTVTDIFVSKLLLFSNDQEASNFSNE